MGHPGRAARCVIVLAISAVLAGGCGETTPTEAAPELAQLLARVDRAVVTGDDARIRNQVEALVSATEEARDAGQLDDEQADRILAAADALLARLPDEAPPPEPSPPASPSPTITPAPEDDGDEGEDEGSDEGEGGEEKPKHKEPKPKPDKEKGKGKKH